MRDVHIGDWENVLLTVRIYGMFFYSTVRCMLTGENFTEHSCIDTLRSTFVECSSVIQEFDEVTAPVVPIDLQSGDLKPICQIISARAIIECDVDFAQHLDSHHNTTSFIQFIVLLYLIYTHLDSRLISTVI